MGEDIPGIGAIRDMENPPAFGDPDSMTSPNYTADVNETDGGGVHTNSGVATRPPSCSPTAAPSTVRP